MPEKIFEWSGLRESISDCAMKACTIEEFEVITANNTEISFKNRGYNGKINFEGNKLKINISANGGLTASTICLCFLVFLFGLQLLNAWYVFSRKPNNFIKKIMAQISLNLQRYPGTSVIMEPIS